MKRRIGFVILYFLLLVSLFVIQKPIFMMLNGALDKYTFSDFISVMYNGVSLDAATAGYLTIIPLLISVVTLFTDKLPLKKIFIPYNLFVALIISIIFVVDSGLYPFWGFKLDASIFLYLDSPKEALASVSIGFIVVRVVAMALLAAIYYYLLTVIVADKFVDKIGKCLQSILFFFITVVLFIIIRGGVTESTSNVGQVYFSNDQFLNHSAVNPLFSLLASLSKTQNFADEYNFFEEDKRGELFEGLYPTTDGDTITEVLKTKRPNLLIILMESFGATFIEPLGGLAEVTPNFNRLSKEGVFFTNCYANSYRTDRGTISALSGYLGLPKTSVMKLPIKSQTLPAISDELLKAGYSTDFLYGGDINFTNMKSYLLSKGYQKTTADKDFSLSAQRSNAWGVNDEITFDYLYSQIVQRRDEPWHTGFLTLSSHEPFEVPYNRIKEKIPNAFAYTDECFGNFIDKLKKSEAWDNLLIVCVADHGFFYPKEGINTLPKFYHIPLLWLGGAVKEPMIVDKIMNQSDLAATLLAQLGIEHSKFNFSRNVLSSDYKYPFAFYTFNDGFSFRDSTGVTVYDNNSNKVIYDEAEGTSDRIDRGKAILQSVHDDLGAR